MAATSSFASSLSASASAHRPRAMLATTLNVSSCAANAVLIPVSDARQMRTASS